MESPTPKASKRLRGRLLYRTVLALSFVARRLPLSTGRAFGRALGKLAWHVARRERKKALHNIAIAFPEWSAAEHQRTIRAMFEHLGQMLFETLWLPNLTPELRAETTVMEGEEAILAAIDAGRGVVAYTGHCGNWEWLANCVAALGRPMTVLQRERDEVEMNDFITELRAGVGMRTVGRGSSNAAREMIASIRRGGFLCFLIDQSIRAESAKVPFFGKPALTPIGPARLNIRTEALAVGIFIERRADGKQYIRFTEIVDTNRGDDAIALTARITGWIEEQIRRAPEQWVWMHDRWRERPRWDVNSKVEVRTQNSE